MITTPEQMREAVARDNDLIRRGDVTAIPMLGMTVTQIERAIRAIPIATQPAAVAVKPLKGIDQQVMAAAALLNEKGRENPEWAFIDYESNAMSFGRWAKCGPNPAPYIRADIVLSALTIQPADPLSDPRVVALVEAAKRALNNLENTESEFGITLESANSLRSSLRAIGGEA